MKTDCDARKPLYSTNEIFCVLNTVLPLWSIPFHSPQNHEKCMRGADHPNLIPSFKVYLNFDRHAYAFHLKYTNFKQKIAHLVAPLHTFMSTWWQNHMYTRIYICIKQRHEKREHWSRTVKTDVRNGQTPNEPTQCTYPMNVGGYKWVGVKHAPLGLRIALLLFGCL